jgi:hypothetical protein
LALPTLALLPPARDAGGHGQLIAKQAPRQAREVADAEAAVGAVLVGHAFRGRDSVVRGIEPGHRTGGEAARGRRCVVQARQPARRHAPLTEFSRGVT